MQYCVPARASSTHFWPAEHLVHNYEHGPSSFYTLRLRTRVHRRRRTGRQHWPATTVAYAPCCKKVRVAAEGSAAAGRASDRSSSFLLAQVRTRTCDCVCMHIALDSRVVKSQDSRFRTFFRRRGSSSSGSAAPRSRHSKLLTANTVYLYCSKKEKILFTCDILELFLSRNNSYLSAHLGSYQGNG